jgi:hypothetical protein
MGLKQKSLSVTFTPSYSYTPVVMATYMIGS